MDFVWLAGREGQVFLQIISNVIIPSIVAFFALTTLINSLLEYQRAQRWKRTEFAAQQMEMLLKDPLIKFCCITLDWEERFISPPPGYEYITEQNQVNNRIFHSRHDHWNGLRLVNEPRKDWAQSPDTQQVSDDIESYTPLEGLYRDAFDHFFSYLESIEYFLEVDLIDKTDVAPLHYWLKLLASNVVYIKYIHQFQNCGVLKLMHRFNIDLSKYNLDNETTLTKRCIAEK